MTKGSTVHTGAYGSCMLMGEHSVLFNQYAVVVALNKRIRVKLIPRIDNHLNIVSSFGEYKTTFHELSEGGLSKLAFVVTTLQQFKKQYPNHTNSGFDLIIDSDIDTEKGFGSSAAVVVAVAKSLLHWKSLEINKQQLWQFCYRIIKIVQGRGSGADVCASIYGRTCVYSQQKGFIKKLDLKWLEELGYCWKLVYCGYKTPTTQVLDHITQQTHEAETHQNIYTRMGQQTLKFINAKEKSSQGLADVISSINTYHRLMVNLGVSDDSIENIVNHAMTKTEYIKAAKISGSGLGDCVLMLSNKDGATTPINGYESFALPID